jgi:hypothetical protein
MQKDESMSKQLSSMCLLMALSLGLPIACASSSADGGGGGPTGSQLSADAEWNIKSADNYELHVASFGAQCPLLQSGSKKASSTVIEFQLTPATGQTAPLAGTYAVALNDTPGGASAKLKPYDASCTAGTQVQAISGSITLASTLMAGGSAVSGTFNVQFEDGTSQAGQFAASYCDDSTSVGTAMCVP